ncbi:MAG: MarR family transcriptional regulator [Clostridia bacterium]|nr:MarR family transcriptional regulator [Clostridia bacterium]
MNIEKNFEIIYSEFRLKLYQNIFKVLGEREGSLTATEFFSVEVIYLLDSPTVSEFAECLNISSSLAAYKVRSLMEKGYLVKIPTDDRRSFRLQVTDKFMRYYHKEDSYGSYIFKMLSESLTQEELETADRLFEKFVKTIEENRKND